MDRTSDRHVTSDICLGRRQGQEQAHSPAGEACAGSEADSGGAEAHSEACGYGTQANCAHAKAYSDYAEADYAVQAGYDNHHDNASWRDHNYHHASWRNHNHHDASRCDHNHHDASRSDYDHPGAQAQHHSTASRQNYDNHYGTSEA